MRLDHIFVMCDVDAPEADALVALGLREGSPNTHPGQGTACRRFFFDGFYLELLWVTDEAVARSPAVARTRLWHRWAGRHTSSPFGIVLRADDGEAPVTWNTWAYRPCWLGGTQSIDFAEDGALAEPAIIVLPPTMAEADAPRQSRTHALPLTRLDAASCACTGISQLSPAARALTALGIVTITLSTRAELVLTFEGDGRGASADLRPTLPIVLAW